MVRSYLFVLTAPWWPGNPGCILFPGFQQHVVKMIYCSDNFSLEITNQDLKTEFLLLQIIIAGLW